VADHPTLLPTRRPRPATLHGDTGHDFPGCRRLQVRDERRADLLLGFLQPVCALTCRNWLDRPTR